MRSVVGVALSLACAQQASAFCPVLQPHSTWRFSASKLRVASADEVSTDAWVSRFGTAPEIRDAAPFYKFFSSFSHEKYPDKPVFLERSELEADFSGYFTLEDLGEAVESDVLQAGRGVAGLQSGWKMARVGPKAADNFLEKKMRRTDVLEAIQAELTSGCNVGTVVFNSAGAHIPKLSAVSLAAVEAFAFPTNTNLYITARNKKLSAPPHTDKQDVFVMQTQGFKHWKVFAPPEPGLTPDRDPYTRGKGDDVCDVASLGEPLLDVILKPGDVLYVPAAYPHTTDTLVREGQVPQEVADQDSVHMTVGVDTYIWGLTYAFLRALTYLRMGNEDRALGGIQQLYRGPINRLPDAVYAKLCRSLPANFVDLKAGGVEEVAGELQQWAAAAAVVTKSEEDFAAIPPEEWVKTVRKAQEHCQDLLHVFRTMYTEAIAEAERRRKSADQPIPIEKLSMFRVRPHMNRLEALMDGFISYATASPMMQRNTNPNLPGPSDLTKAEEAVQWVAAKENPPSRGDLVQVDLGGAWFEARVLAVRGLRTSAA
eukprot:scaffold459_cov249-Pinguiococcus_pyrenoidosus.AAC.10